MNTEQFDGHTPGPWDADYDPYVAMLDRGESMDVLTIRVPTSEDDEVAWKNQHLAAAAPDLLAEVKRLREAFLIATGHVGYGNHLGHNELRHALNSVGIDADSLPWADGEWSEEE